MRALTYEMTRQAGTMEVPMMVHSAKGRESSHSMRLREVCRVYDTGIGVSNRRCDAEAACTMSAVCRDMS